MVFENLSVYSDYGFLAMRLGLASIFFYEGYSKLKDPKGFASSMKWGTWKGVLLGLLEFAAAIMLLGIFVRIGALLVVVTMLGAMYYNLFVWKTKFMDGSKVGWAYNVIILAGAIALLLGDYRVFPW